MGIHCLKTQKKHFSLLLFFADFFKSFILLFTPRRDGWTHSTCFLQSSCVCSLQFHLLWASDGAQHPRGVSCFRQSNYTRRQLPTHSFTNLFLPFFLCLHKCPLIFARSPRSQGMEEEERQCCWSGRPSFGLHGGLASHVGLELISGKSQCIVIQ